GYYSIAPEYEPIFRALGGLTGKLGIPLGPKVSVETLTNGSGAGQQFADGTIYASAAGIFAVYGAVRDAYWAAGSNVGILGWPTSEIACSAGDCWQAFQGGLAFSNGNVVTGAYADA